MRSLLVFRQYTRISIGRVPSYILPASCIPKQTFLRNQLPSQCWECRWTGSNSNDFAGPSPINTRASAVFRFMANRSKVTFVLVERSFFTPTGSIVKSNNRRHFTIERVTIEKQSFTIVTQCILLVLRSGWNPFINIGQPFRRSDIYLLASQFGLHDFYSYPRCNRFWRCLRGHLSGLGMLIAALRYACGSVNTAGGPRERS